MEKRKLPIKQILLVLLTVAILAAFAVFDKDVHDIDDVLNRMSPAWLLGALGVMCVYLLGDTAVYALSARALKVRRPFGESLLTTMLGVFYSAVTPLSSGGQPFQVMQMARHGIRPGTATAIMMLKFLAWHIAVTLYAFVGFLLFGRVAVATGAYMTVMFCIGFSLHVACAVLGILLTVRPFWVDRAGVAVIGWIGKNFLRRSEERRMAMLTAWARFVGDYSEAAHFAAKHKKQMLGILLCAAIEVTAYYSLTFFVYRGLGFQEPCFAEMLFLNAILMVSVAFTPLPGASGASEGAFYILFNRYFGTARLAAMLIWRVLTYYFSILTGLIAVLIDGFRTKHKKEQTECI